MTLIKHRQNKMAITSTWSMKVLKNNTKFIHSAQVKTRLSFKYLNT